MTATQLPERPNLDQLKRQAKDLLRAARADDARRARAFPHASVVRRTRRTTISRARPSRSMTRSRSSRASTDSTRGTRCREHVEELTLEFDARGRRVHRSRDRRPTPIAPSGCLALHPRIARANFHAALLLGDAAVVHARLADDPGARDRARRPARVGAAALRVLHVGRRASSLRAKRAWSQIARAPHRARRRCQPAFPLAASRRAAARCSGAPCASCDRSACQRPCSRPAPIRATASRFRSQRAAGDIAALELLLAHGADVNQPVGDRRLRAALRDSALGQDSTHGARWLLEHGADADPVFAPNGETPLHVVAASWDADLAERSSIEAPMCRAGVRTAARRMPSPS